MNQPTDALLRPRTVRRDIIILLVTTVGLLAPFLAKPVHVDDPLFVWTAQQIAAHPRDFFGFDLNWSGHRESMSLATMNPPLLPYYFAAVAQFTGWSEVALHAATLPFSMLSVLGLYFLARQFCKSPLSATLLMIFCPAFLVSATTLMCEVPMLCLWLWAMLAWTRGSTHSRIWLAFSGCLTGVASLTKYQAVCVIPLLIAHAILFHAPRRTRIVQALSLLIPLLMIAAYDRFTAAHYGHGMFLRALGFSSNYSREHGSSTAVKLLDALAFAGGGTIAAVLTGFFALPRRWAVAAIASIPLMIWAAWKMMAAPGGWNSPWPFDLQAGILAAAGICIAIVCIFSVNRQTRTGLFLLLWAGGVFVFAAKLNWSVNARTILPLVPPVCILTQRAIERRQVKNVRRFVLAGSVAACFTVLLTLADFESAAANRWAALHLMKGRSPQKVWFTGHWAFQYYMQQQGTLPLEESSPACKPGDLVVWPLNNYGAPPRGLEPIDSLTADTFPLLTSLNVAMGANFYFSAGDRLPFVFGPIPSENFVVYRVPAGWRK